MSPELYRVLALGVLAAALPTLVVLTWIAAPYGRHVHAGWGPEVPGRLGWVVMESPSVFLFGAVFLAGAHLAEPVPWILLGLWMLHYVHRTLVYPFRLASTRPMPVLVVCLAFAFQTANSAANAAWIGDLGHYPVAWLSDPRFVVGTTLFLVGEAVNTQADTALMKLRRDRGPGYHIPTGGLYGWITCPNYLGEIVAWVGWALATWSLAGVAFAAFTVANLAPRALANHRWYRERFPDYPPGRRALVPFLL